MSRALAVLLVLAASVTACTGSESVVIGQDAPPVVVGSPPAAPAPTAAVPSVRAPAPAPPPATVEPVWTVGASPLPLRPDGFGEVLPTPEVLRNRRLPTADLLPPPADGRFTSSIAPVSPAVRERMGESWSERCPVGLDDLRYVTVSFRGFDGAAHTGEIVVAASVADDVVEVFRRLYAADFPIEEMRLVATSDLEAAPTGDGNNTAGYVCRAARGQTRFSAHAYGVSVDVNPFQNPYVKRDLVLPELASAYTARDDVRPGMHLPGGPAVEAFRDIGWTWGGNWRSTKDPMHFSLTGD